MLEACGKTMIYKYQNYCRAEAHVVGVVGKKRMCVVQYYMQRGRECGPFRFVSGARQLGQAWRAWARRQGGRGPTWFLYLYRRILLCVPMVWRNTEILTLWIISYIVL